MNIPDNDDTPKDEPEEEDNYNDHHMPDEQHWPFSEPYDGGEPC